MIKWIKLILKVKLDGRKELNICKHGRTSFFHSESAHKYAEEVYELEDRTYKFFRPILKKIIGW